MFELIETGIEGCVELFPRMFQDDRGKFVKIFHEAGYKALHLHTSFEEEYYSVSMKGVLRGLHFQVPPHAHTKLVSCVSGRILDVVVDLRKDSPTFSKVVAAELNPEKGNLMYVPEGLAHGFYVMSDSAVFLSMNSRQFSPECDMGIRWDSIDFAWPDPEPVLSEKDKNLIPLGRYNSPF